MVRNDDAVGTRQAVEHLVGLGHRAIAYIDGGANPGGTPSAGYRAAMADHGLDAEIRVVPGGYTEDEGARRPVAAADGLPTAVIAANDLCAIGVLDAVIRAGVRVPDDLSVIGYDDSRFARLPGIDLTSVRQDIPKMARLAVKAAVERLERPTRKPKDVVLRPKLVVRGTTAAPREVRPRRGRDSAGAQPDAPMSPGAGPRHHSMTTGKIDPRYGNASASTPGWDEIAAPAHRRAALLDHHGPGGRAAARGAARGRLARRRVRVLHRGERSRSSATSTRTRTSR